MTVVVTQERVVKIIQNGGGSGAGGIETDPVAMAALADLEESIDEQLEELQAELDGIDLSGLASTTALGAETTARQSADTAEASSRASADTALGGRIDGEATARAAADSGEATARAAADSALGGRIDTEATARQGADTALGTRIDTEASDRAEADEALGIRVDSEESARANAIAAEATARNAAISAAITNLVNLAPGALDTLGELATALQSEQSGLAALTVTVGGKQSQHANLTAISALTTTAWGLHILELGDAVAGRAYLGLGTAATHAHSEYEVAGAAATAQAAAIANAIQRSNHTGSQAISTVTGLQTALDSKETAGAAATAQAAAIAASAPLVHKSRHATGGADALTPADIGAGPAWQSGTHAQRLALAGMATGTPFFETETKILYRWDGAAWVPQSPGRIPKLADQTVNNSTTLVDDTHFTWPVENGEEWYFEGRIKALSPSAAADWKMQLVCANATGRIGAGGTASSPGHWNPVAVGTTPIAAPADSVPFSVGSSAAGTMFLWFAGFVTGSGAGSAKIQWAQDTLVVGDSKWLKGSFLRLERLI